jgi:ABC-2 type transport system ATP-binding protein
VRFSTRSADAATLGEKLAPLAARTEVLSDAGGVVVMRAYPRERGGNGAFVGSIADAARRESWQLDEIHVEEGRLDEVFRAITLPDTVKGAH